VVRVRSFLINCTLVNLFSDGLFTASYYVRELALASLLKLLLLLHISQVDALRMHGVRVLAMVDTLLLSLLFGKLVSQTRDRASNFSQSTLLFMLNVQVREESLNVLWPDSLWREVVHHFDLASLESLALFGNLLFDKPVNLGLQVFFLVNYFVI